MRNFILVKLNWRWMMNRFTVCDEFGGALRSFYSLSDAKVFMRNKRGCTVKEITLFEILGECLW